MRVIPGDTDTLPTTRRASFAATTAISRRSSNAAAADASSKGGDFEEGLPLDIVEEPDSLTEHGMPVVFEVRFCGGREREVERRRTRREREGRRRGERRERERAIGNKARRARSRN